MKLFKNPIKEIKELNKTREYEYKKINNLLFKQNIPDDENLIQQLKDLGFNNSKNIKHYNRYLDIRKEIEKYKTLREGRKFFENKYNSKNSSFSLIISEDEIQEILKKYSKYSMYDVVNFHSYIPESNVQELVSKSNEIDKKDECYIYDYSYFEKKTSSMNYAWIENIVITQKIISYDKYKEKTKKLNKDEYSYCCYFNDENLELEKYQKVENDYSYVYIFGKLPLKIIQKSNKKSKNLIVLQPLYYKNNIFYIVLTHW